MSRNIAQIRFICNDFLVDFVGISEYIFYRKFLNEVSCSNKRRERKTAYTGIRIPF
jgi:hypothetical protein